MAFSGVIIAAIVLAKICRNNNRNDNRNDNRNYEKEDEDNEVKEGLKMPKFPSVNDIAKPILKPIEKIPDKITSGVNKLIKPIKEDIKQQIKSVAKIGDQITKGFKKIGDTIKQGFQFILFFPQCCLWYILHILGYVLYAPVAFLVWVLGMHSIEKMAFEYINMIDGNVHRATGVHPFHFSDDIQARCYFKKVKSRDIHRTSGSNISVGSLDDESVDDSEQLGYVILILFICILGVFGLTLLFG